MSLNFDLIPPTTAELAALVRPKNIVSPDFIAVSIQIFYTNNYNLLSFNEFRSV